MWAIDLAGGPPGLQASGVPAGYGDGCGVLGELGAGGRGHLAVAFGVGAVGSQEHVAALYQEAADAVAATFGDAPRWVACT